jgi:hypothetical protein
VSTQELARRIRNPELGALGMRLLRRFDVVDQLAHVTCPTLVCVGEDARSSDRSVIYGLGMATRYEYTVVELREGLIGGKMSGDKLAKVLNQHAAQGWQLKAITSVEVKGRVGPGGVEGILVTFERPVG